MLGTLSQNSKREAELGSRSILRNVWIYTIGSPQLRELVKLYTEAVAFVFGVEA